MIADAVHAFHSNRLMIADAVQFVSERALAADFSSGAGERIVLREDGECAGEVFEEVILALRHLLHIRPCP